MGKEVIPPAAVVADVDFEDFVGAQEEFVDTGEMNRS